MKKLLMGLLLATTSLALADSVTVTMYQTGEKMPGKKLGTVKFVDSKNGLLVEPHLQDLPPGLHGMHIHAVASCKDMGMAAGGHFDPANTGKHLGPTRLDGHKGDLPILDVNSQGKPGLAMLAPKLTVKDLKGHALIIHAGGDNYSDEPEKLGGGGARIACGVIK